MYEEKDVRLEKQMAFIRETDKMKNIVRQSYIADGSRKETDAEHSWHLALMALLLSEYANEAVDTQHVVAMTLVHDLIEIDAGDTYAYDAQANQSKKEREQKAADRLFSMLPEDQGRKLYALWEEFEANETPEARFANALDKCQPVILNDASGGKSWKEHGVRDAWIYGRNEKTPEGSRTLWAYMQSLIEKNTENGNIIKEVPDEL